MSTYKLVIGAVATLLFTAFISIPAFAGGGLSIGDDLIHASTRMMATSGDKVSISDVKGDKGTLVIFTCNHCPYVIKYQERIDKLAHKYMKKGIGVIAINANDPKKYADDGFDGMVKRANELKIKYPYVQDETQDVARDYGAGRTPEFYLFDANDKLVYHGTLDDNVQEPKKVNQTYLKDALNAVVKGKSVKIAETKAVGCSIKWKS